MDRSRPRDAMYNLGSFSESRRFVCLGEVTRAATLHHNLNYIFLICCSWVQIGAARKIHWPVRPAPRVKPPKWIWRVSVKIDVAIQPNRIRRKEPADVWIVISEGVVVQPRIPIQILSLKPQVLLPGLVLGLIAFIKAMHTPAIGLDQLPFLSLRVAPGLVRGLPDQVALAVR